MSPETIDAMVAAGASAEVIAAAWKAELASQDRAIQERREKDRIRQRRKRHAESRGVTRTERDTPPNDNNLTPPCEEKPEPKGSVKKFPAPDGVSDEQWLAFRKQRKKPINERSYTLLCNKLVGLAEHGYPPGEMIDLAIERGWETVFEPRGTTNVGKLQRTRASNPLDALYRMSGQPGDPSHGDGARLSLPPADRG